ncbi:MAG TPA: DUF885 domain-containing protein [Steroidobacteraceae bacterium]|nr:DUF885 domain-containing protein [Steroidobacteraceae bacterium]
MSRSLSLCRLFVSVALILALVSCGKSEQPAPAADATAAATAASAAPWSTFREQFLEGYFKAHPVFAVNAGRHEYDGQLPDWSAAGIAAEIKRLHEARDATAAFDAAALADADRFERDYLAARLDRGLFWLEIAEAPFHNPAFYLDWIDDGLDPAPYLTREYAPLEQRMRAYIAYLRAVPAAAKQIKANLRAPLALPLLERGVSAFKGFADFYSHDAVVTFASIKDAALQGELKSASASAAAAMRDVAGWLEAQRSSATGSFALGPEKFALMLKMTERVTTPLADLEAVGRADLERNLAALREACAQYAPGKSIQVCFDKMQENKPTAGAVEGARQQLAGLRQFIVDKQVVTIPGTEEARVAEAPPYNRANHAYIEIPGPYEKGLPATYNIAPPDPSWTEKERHDYISGRADLLFTSVHEVWPGHFLQFLHSNRSGSIVGRLFVGYAFAEGWAHYGEEMMWEMGLGNGDPETHIGQLSNALLRDARFLSAIGLHTHGMTVAESERLFREEAFQDTGTARQQAARGTYDPAYLNYTMGKLMIRKLREEWTANRGGRAAWHDFHDQLLSYGGPPLPMIRKAMLGKDEGPLF